MAQRAPLGVKLRRCDQLLTKVRGGVDEKPVIAVSAESDRGLCAPEIWMLAARLQAHLAAAIPLRYAAAGGCAQDDDAKHDPFPENKNAKRDAKYHEGGHRSRHALRSRHAAGGPPASKYVKCRSPITCGSRSHTC